MTTGTTAISTAASTSPSTSSACSACGHHGTDPIERSEVAMTWLLPVPQRPPVARHFCRACAPHDAVDEITCIRCGDGPLLAGELTQMDLHTVAAVDACLTAYGWQMTGPVCPDCRRDIAR